MHTVESFKLLEEFPELSTRICEGLKSVKRFCFNALSRKAD